MNDDNRASAGELVTTAPSKSVLNDMANRYGMMPEPFEQTVRAICMPATHTREQFAAFLLVAKEYHLNPLTKEIYAFPAKGGGIIPVVSIDGWVSLVNSHPQCDGFTFSWVQDDKGDPISCTCIMYRKDRSHPVEVTEYLAECIRPTDPWKMKHRMLRHKAMIQGARYAFGFSGIYDEDEGAKIAESQERQIAPPPPPMKSAEPTPSDIVIDQPEPFDPAKFHAELIDLMALANTEDAVIEAWDNLDVEAALTNHEEWLQKAFDARKLRIADVTEKPFPGDVK